MLNYVLSDNVEALKYLPKSRKFFFW